HRHTCHVCLPGLFGNVLGCEAEVCPYVVLLSSFVQEGIGCADAEETGSLRGLLRQPLGDAATESTKSAVLLNRYNDGESGEGLSEKGFVQWLDRMEAHNLGGNASEGQLRCRLDSHRQHISRAQQTDIVPLLHHNAFADPELRGLLVHEWFALLAKANI